eukprot:857087_1
MHSMDVDPSVRVDHSAISPQLRIISSPADYSIDNHNYGLQFECDDHHYDPPRNTNNDSNNNSNTNMAYIFRDDVSSIHSAECSDANSIDDDPDFVPSSYDVLPDDMEYEWPELDAKSNNNQCSDNYYNTNWRVPTVNESTGQPQMPNGSTSFHMVYTTWYTHMIARNMP